MSHCKVPACQKPVRAMGFCTRHYRLNLNRRTERKCAVDGCTKPVNARGMCNGHYMAEWRASGPCSALGCTTAVERKGMCGKHYQASLPEKPPKLLGRPCRVCGGPVTVPADKPGAPLTVCSERCRLDARNVRERAVFRKHNPQVMQPRSLTCVTCGRDFNHIGSGRPVRCGDCRQMGIKGDPRECAECGGLYLPRTWRARLCERDECRRINKLRRMDEARAIRDSQWVPGPTWSDPSKRGRRYRLECEAPGLSRSKRYALVRHWRKQGRLCAYCGIRAAETHDHVVPLFRGGTNWEGNLAPCCRSCNSSKKNRTVMEWRMFKDARLLAVPAA